MLSRLAYLRLCRSFQLLVRSPAGTPEECINAFMLLAGTRAGGHRAGRVDECRLADPHRRRSAGWVGLVLAARAHGVGGVRCSARRKPKDLRQMPTSHNQEPVKALGANGAHRSA
jgi:hypothetical protein